MSSPCILSSVNALIQYHDVHTIVLNTVMGLMRLRCYYEHQIFKVRSIRHCQLISISLSDHIAYTTGLMAPFVCFFPFNCLCLNSMSENLVEGIVFFLFRHSIVKSDLVNYPIWVFTHLP